MTYGGGPQGGYFCTDTMTIIDRYRNYKIHRNWGTAFDLNTRVGRVELVDDPDIPDGHEVKAVKVWPAAVPAEVLAAVPAEVLAAEDPAAEVQDEADDPQYQEPCWYCGTILHINMPIFCIKHITGEEHTVCGGCWRDEFEDDQNWVDMDASSEEDSDAE